MPAACQALSQVVSFVRTVLQIGLSFPILETKTKTENWHGLGLNPAFSPAQEGALARRGSHRKEGSSDYGVREEGRMR